MVVEGFQRGGWAAETFLTHEVEPIIHCLEVIDDSALNLALLPTPRAVGHPIEVV